MNSKILLTLVSLLLFISCDKSSVFSEFDKMPTDNRWQKSDVKIYEFSIDDDSKLYNLEFKFSHIYDYQFDSVPINFAIENPSGKTEKFTIDLMIKDDSGKELGECSVDICDLNFKIKEASKLEKGTYKITISNGFKRKYLPNVLGIGLDVDAIK